MTNSNYATALDTADYDPYDRKDRFLKAQVYATLALVDAVESSKKPVVVTPSGPLTTVYAVARATAGVTVTLEVYRTRKAAEGRKEELDAASNIHKLGLEYYVLAFDVM